MKSILEGISADASQYKHMVPAAKDANYDLLVRCLQETHRHIEALCKLEADGFEAAVSRRLENATAFSEKLRQNILNIYQKTI